MADNCFATPMGRISTTTHGQLRQHEVMIHCSKRYTLRVRIFFGPNFVRSTSVAIQRMRLKFWNEWTDKFLQDMKSLSTVLLRSVMSALLHLRDCVGGGRAAIPAASRASRSAATRYLFPQSPNSSTQVRKKRIMMISSSPDLVGKYC